MSVTAQVGLAGVSSQTSLVAPGRTAAAMASVRSASTNSTSRPHWVAKVASQLRSDQYITLGATTWSPGARARKQAVAALMPDEKISAFGAAFERGQRRLGLVEGRIVGARIDAAGAIAVVLVALIGARHMDRRHDGLRHRIDPAHGLGGERCGGDVLFCHHCTSEAYDRLTCDAYSASSVYALQGVGFCFFSGTGTCHNHCVRELRLSSLTGISRMDVETVDYAAAAATCRPRRSRRAHA